MAGISPVTKLQDGYNLKTDIFVGDCIRVIWSGQFVFVVAIKIDDESVKYECEGLDGPYFYSRNEIRKVSIQD